LITSPRRKAGRRRAIGSSIWRGNIAGWRQGSKQSSGRRNRSREQQQIANIRRPVAHRARWEHSRSGACFRGMADPFHRAEDWRQRADQLRNLAVCTRDPVASTSLDLMAEALEQHARKLEEMALKMRCTHRRLLVRATTGRDLQVAGGTAD
jgi:hypothetical protein